MTHDEKCEYTEVQPDIRCGCPDRAIAALRAEVERLRAYLPLARAAEKWRTTTVGSRADIEGEMAIHRAANSLTPEQRRALMEGA